MLPTKIVIIGAGSASFGTNTLGTLMRSEKLRGSHIALVDLNPESLALVARLAERINREWGSGMTISSHTHHKDALPGAQFVVISIEVSPREQYWQSDFNIPLKYGVRQPYAENGGPGGFAHAARNIHPIMEIVHDMEKLCPDAWVVNFTNPMTRICDAIHRYSQIKVVGLCHQIKMGYAMVGKALAKELEIQESDEFISTHASPRYWQAASYAAKQAMDRIQITAAGLNHFTWMLSVNDRKTGEDLYPLFNRNWQSLPESFEPLTRRIYAMTGIFPIPGDEHLCEYLPWVSNPITKPWEKFDLELYEWDLMEELRIPEMETLQAMASGEMEIEDLREADTEGAEEVIENIAGAGQHFHMAVNLPNHGYISNLPNNAIVEVPGVVSGAGVQGVGIGQLPRAVAELCRREITSVQLCVDAAVSGDRQLALQCLCLDPVITDLDIAQKILDDYLNSYRDVLPQFWK